MTRQTKIGVLTMALLEDAYNKTAHMRPAATETARGVARALEPYGTVVHPGLVEDEDQAAAAARQFNAEGVDIIVAMELAYTKGLVPAAASSTPPLRCWSGTPSRSGVSRRETDSTSSCSTRGWPACPS